MVDRAQLVRRFDDLFGGRPRLFEAPGRVNLIGEHTDYNDGFVLPMAIDRGTLVAAVARPGSVLRVHSVNEEQTLEADLSGPGTPRRGSWIDYVEGTARALRRRGVDVPGADIALAGDVPLGSGLSSSASLEISIGLALSSLAGAGVPPAELALAGQEAEHTWVGTQCGIMDQLIAATGRAGHALLIDCRSLAVRPVPLDLPDTSIVVTDTGVRHALASSAYNVRRAECARAVELLRARLPGITALRDVSPEALAAHEDALPDPERRRARHVVGENARTLAAADAFARGDVAEAGRLMVLSHRSLATDYEVSVPELDLLVALACAQPGVSGARMTGGGFGGSTVTLVSTRMLPSFERTVREEYRRATGREAAVRAVAPADGAREISA